MNTWYHLHWSHRDALKRARQFERLLVGFENEANIIHIRTARALIKKGFLHAVNPGATLRPADRVALTDTGRQLLDFNAPA